MPLTQQDVLAALRTVKDPELHRDIVSLGMVKGIEIDGTRVALAIELTSPASPLKDSIRREVAAALSNTDATEFGLELSYRGSGNPQASAAGAGGGRAEGPSNPLPQIGSVVAVGAGKGGVGKSTV